MKRVWTKIDEEKAILPIVAVILSIAYLYLIYVFRPSNSVAFPGVEERIWTALLIFVIASTLAYAREILNLLRVVLSGLTSRLFDGVTRGISKLQTRAMELIPLLAEHYAPRIKGCIPEIKVDRALAPVFNFTRSVKTKAMRAASRAIKQIKEHFSFGRPYYFVTLGLAAFLILSPLVIGKQRELTEPAVLIFVAYIALSCWKKIDDRVMIVSMLMFLLSCPFLLIMKENVRAELAAIYAFYSLCAGLILRFVDNMQNQRRCEKEERTDTASGEKTDPLSSQVQEIEKGCFKIRLPLMK